MNKKNILLISPFFFPEPISTGKYNTELAVALAKKGHEVTVLCFHPFYPEWKIKKTKKNIPNLKIVRGGSFLFFSNKPFIRRIILEISFAFFVLRKIKHHQKNKDIILPVFPPSLAFYSVLPFLKKQIKKIGIVHDLQEIYSAEKKGLLNSILKRCIHKIERKCFKKCDKLIFLSHEMKEEAQKIYQLKPTQCRVQYPFVNIIHKKAVKTEAIFAKNKTNIVYSGALGEKQNPYKLYQFFNEASLKNNKLVFYFFSEGSIFNTLKNQNRNQQIKFYSLVEKESLGALYNASDVQIVPQKENTSKGSLPSKLPNLFASNCKILAITDAQSEIEQIFNQYNIPQVCTSWKLENLIKALDTLIKKEVNYSHQKEAAKKLFSLNNMISEITI